MLGAPGAVVASGGGQPAGPGADVDQHAEHDQGEESGNAVPQDRELGAGSRAGKPSGSDVPGQTEECERGKRKQRVPFRSEGESKAESGCEKPGTYHQSGAEPAAEIGDLALFEIAGQTVSEPLTIGNEAGH